MQINFIKLTTLSLLFFMVLSYNLKSSDYEPLTKESNDEIEAIFNQFILKAESASMDNIYNDDFNTSTSCKVCRGVVDALRGLVLEKYGVQGFYKVMTMLCSQFMDEVLLVIMEILFLIVSSEEDSIVKESAML